jgi:tRNA pseudouridine55 synthase
MTEARQATAQGAPVHGILVVDKPQGPTSHDVVAVARRALGLRGVGHAGTLDPMATGVLVLAVGEATKLVSHLTAEAKEYTAEVTLGTATDTLDAMGSPVAEAPLPPDLSEARVLEALARFRGALAQRAPAVSAIKQGGRRLHERVRRGEVVEAPVRQVEVHALELLAWTPPTLTLRVACSKGFYVRSLARDLAEALGTVGHLSMLRRTRSGAFDLDQAVGFEVLRATARGDAAARERLRGAVHPLAEACRALPGVALSTEGADDASHGRPVHVGGCASGALPEVPEGQVLVLWSPSERPLALAVRQGDRLRVVRGFRPTC